MSSGAGYRLLILLSTLAGCGAPAGEEPAPAAGGALDGAAYARRLAEAAAGPVSVDRIVELAQESAARIERRMDSYAEDAGTPGGWRPVFAALLVDLFPLAATGTGASSRHPLGSTRNRSREATARDHE